MQRILFTVLLMMLSAQGLYAQCGVFDFNPRFVEMHLGVGKTIYVNFSDHVPPDTIREMRNVLLGDADGICGRQDDFKGWLGQYETLVKEHRDDLAKIISLINQQGAVLLASEGNDTALIKLRETLRPKRTQIENSLRGCGFSASQIKDTLLLAFGKTTYLVAIDDFKGKSVGLDADRLIKKTDEAFEGATNARNLVNSLQMNEQIRPSVYKRVVETVNSIITLLNMSTAETFDLIKRQADSAKRTLQTPFEGESAMESKLRLFADACITAHNNFIEARHERDQFIASKLYGLHGIVVATLGTAHRNGVINHLLKMCSSAR